VATAAASPQRRAPTNVSAALYSLRPVLDDSWCQDETSPSCKGWRVPRRDQRTFRPFYPTRPTDRYTCYNIHYDYTKPTRSTQPCFLWYRWIEYQH